MDSLTLEKIAEFICGDDRSTTPKYRKGPDLTSFFERAGLPRFRHDGSSRKPWTLQTLQSCDRAEHEKVVLRLASPKEYGGDTDQLDRALTTLNKLLLVEGIEVFIDGVEPKLKQATARVTNPASGEPERESMSPPNFARLGLDAGIPELLDGRWEEADRCIKAEAHLAGIIIMGSLLEGLLLGVVKKLPREANESAACPKRPDGTPKRFHEWSLNELIEVARAERWVDLDVHRFSHVLRDFRNLVHPYQQLSLRVTPDKDTAAMCWLVVKAAVNDLARFLDPSGEAERA